MSFQPIQAAIFLSIGMPLFFSRYLLSLFTVLSFVIQGFIWTLKLFPSYNALMDRKIGYGLKKFIKTTLIQVFKCYCLKKIWGKQKKKFAMASAPWWNLFRIFLFLSYLIRIYSIAVKHFATGCPTLLFKIANSWCLTKPLILKNYSLIWFWREISAWQSSVRLSAKMVSRFWLGL